MIDVCKSSSLYDIQLTYDISDDISVRQTCDLISPMNELVAKVSFV